MRPKKLLIFRLFLCFGLAACFQNCDKKNTIREFNLKPAQRVLFAHTVGYPE